MRIGICESAAPLRTQLLRWIEQYCALYGCRPELTAYSGVAELIEAMELARFHTVMLSMDGPEGFLAARRLREIAPASKLVFMTDTAQYAVMGVRIHLTDYIVKPVEFKNIVRALNLAGLRE